MPTPTNAWMKKFQSQYAVPPARAMEMAKLIHNRWNDLLAGNA